MITKIDTIEEKNICDLYNKGISLFNLRIQYKTNIYRLQDILKKNNINIRTCKKYSVNHNYFETIDTEEKAYWLGWLYADGCNVITQQRGTVKIGLQEPDKYIVEKFASDIKYTGKIYCVNRNSKNKNHQNIHTLAINSRKLSNDLFKIGMIPRKSLTVEFPNLQQQFIPAFINGVFDGDGCICNYLIPCKKLRATIVIVSSKKFCESLHEILKINFDIDSGVFHPKTTKVWNLVIRKQDSVLKFFKTIYKNRKFFLKRKYDKFIEYFNHRKIIL